MAYVPPKCEHFIPFKPGWICCGCGHFNAMKAGRCWLCEHERCPVLLQSPDFDRRSEASKKPRGKKKSAKKIETEVDL